LVIYRRFFHSVNPRFIFATLFRTEVSSLYRRVEIFSPSSWGKVFVPEGGDQLSLVAEVLSFRDFLQKNNVNRLSVSERVNSEITFYKRFAEGIYPIRITNGTTLILICYWEKNSISNGFKL